MDALLKAKKVTMSDLHKFLASRADVTVATFLNGGDVSETYALLIAEFFGCTVDDLLSSNPVTSYNNRVLDWVARPAMLKLSLEEYAEIRMRLPQDHLIGDLELNALMQGSLFEGQKHMAVAPDGICPKCGDALEKYGNCASCNYYSGA